MTNQESVYKSVYQMYVVEGLPSREIRRVLLSRASYFTIREYIRKAIEEAEANGVAVPLREKPPAGTLPFADTKPLSQTHSTIGFKLNRYRLRSEMSPTNFCRSFQFANRIRLRQMELGQHDLTLSEMLRIAEILGTSLSSLTEAATPYVIRG